MAYLALFSQKRKKSKKLQKIGQYGHRKLVIAYLQMNPKMFWPKNYFMKKVTKNIFFLVKLLLECVLEYSNS
jgi:hypothetical protein